jgi:hypothetical protein
MFQIETALLDFEGPVNVDTGKMSVVKRCVHITRFPLIFLLKCPIACFMVK